MKFIKVQLDCESNFSVATPTNNGNHSGSPGTCTLIICCKDLRQFKLEFQDYNEYLNVSDTLEKLSAIGKLFGTEKVCQSGAFRNTYKTFFSVDISSHYAFYYNPNYKLIEDGWALFQPEDEFAKIIRLADSDWRISYVNIDSSVSLLMLHCNKMVKTNLFSYKFDF